MNVQEIEIIIGSRMAYTKKPAEKEDSGESKKLKWRTKIENIRSNKTKSRSNMK